MQILDKGEIGLLDSMGTDETIAKAAWVSYGKQENPHSEEAVAKLVNYLMKHKHGTPFEHVVFQFYVKAPIFVAREWFRHRIGSLNEISGRYVTFEPEFYIPPEFRVKGSSNKQGSVIPDNVWFEERNLDKKIWNENMREVLTSQYESAYNAYKTLLDAGVANEIARMVLPVSLYTHWWWTVNLRSLFNFMNLRSGEDAQWEIRQYSKALEDIVKDKVPVAYEAWQTNGRNAP